MQWAMHLMEVVGYAGVVLVMLLETALPVLPSEVTLPFIGFLTTRGTLTLGGAVAASTLGALAGALILYSLSYAYGRSAVNGLVARFGRYLGIDLHGLDGAERAFVRLGPVAVFLCRMVPVLRCLISIPAGVTRMRLAAFVAFTTLGAFLWNLALIWGGSLLGNAWERVGHWAHLFGYAALAAILVAWAAHTWYRRGK